MRMIVRVPMRMAVRPVIVGRRFLIGVLRMGLVVSGCFAVGIVLMLSAMIMAAT